MTVLRDVKINKLMLKTKDRFTIRQWRATL
jgi:hypothetical protein